jgi:maltooligosyltrehalose trehalohydrolase
LLFQGQEYGASQPFLFFSDHNEQLAELVEKGRTQFLSQFPSLANGDAEFIEGRPNERRTFERCILDHSERERHPHWLALHKDLLRLRKEDPVFRSQRSDTMHGAVLGLEAFLIRFFDRRHGDRLLLVNLGVDLRLHAASEPLLAAPAGTDWDVLWSSEDPEYGGSGTPPMRQTGKWTLPGHSAVVMYERTGN